MISKEEYLARFETPAPAIGLETNPSAPLDAGLSNSFTPEGTHPEGYFDSTELTDDNSAGRAIMGTFSGVGVELGAGIGGSAYLKYGALGRKIINLGRAGKVAAGAQAATGAGALTGVATFAASEAVIWGASNFLGQKTRQAFGIQEETSAAEMLAASLFGATVVARGADKLFKLGQGVNDLNAWKNLSGTLSGKRAFLSGASLGIAETALRQELQILMNEDANRNAYEYLFAGVLGGSFNSIFNAWARSGSWGVSQMETLSQRTLKANQDAIDSVKEEIRNAKGPVRGMRKRLRELLKARRNLEDFNDYVNKTKETQEALDSRNIDNNDLSPEELKAEQARRQSETEAETPEQPRTPEPEEPAVAPETPEFTIEPDINPEYIRGGERSKVLGYKVKAGDGKDYYIAAANYEADPAIRFAVYEGVADQSDDTLLTAFRTKKEAVDALKAKKAEAPAEPTPAPKTPEEPKIVRDKEEIVTDEEETSFVFSEQHQDVLSAIKESENDLTFASKKDFTTRLPTVGRRLKPRQEQLTLDIDSKVKALVRKKQVGEDITADEIASLKSDVYLLRRMNDTLDLVETVGGRSLQGLSGDAGKYGKYITQYSARSYAQRAALIRFQNSLDTFTPGGTSKTRDAIDAISEYMETPEKFGLTGRLRFGEIEDLRGELDEMEWNDVKTLAKDYNDNLPEGAEPIKLSGKGVTRQSIKDRIAKDFQVKREASKVKGRVRKTLDTLEKRLVELRSRHFTTETYSSLDGTPNVDKYGKEIVAETEQTVVSQATKNALNNDPDILRIKAQIKYYKDSIDDLDKIEKLEAELDELAGIEGRGVISEIEQKVLKKYKISPPQVKTKVDELKTKISESKKRMRDKIKDIRKAEDQLETARIAQDYEDTLSAALDVAPTAKYMKVLQTGNTWRKMNLINQLPSVLAGIPTSVYATVREGFARPAVTFVRQFTGTDKDSSLAMKLAGDEFMGFWSAFFSNRGIGEAAKRAFKEGRDPTTGNLTRFAEDFRGKMTLEGTVQRAKRRIITEAQSQEGMDNVLSKIFNVANLTNIFSVGIRGIGVLDAITKRQLIQGTLTGQSLKQARLELSGKPGVSEKQILDRAEQLYNSKWKDDDGLQVLDALGEHEQFVDDINESILLARKHMDPELIHQNMGDTLIKMIKNASGTSEEAELIVAMFMPYISVPIKGAYLGLKLTVPGNYVRARYHNPYINKIKTLEDELKTRELAKAKAEKDLQNPELTENARSYHQGVMDSADEFAENLKVKKAKLERYAENYTQNALMSDAMAFGLFGAGFAMGSAGYMTGSLNWMSADQREKNKLTPFMGMNMDYRAASPLAIPLAIGADLAHYLTLKNQGQLKETQNIIGMVTSTMITLTQEVPLFQGLKSITTLVSGGADTKVSELANIGSGYIPVPAQVRKTIQAVAIAGGDRTIADLRGASFNDRALYKILGVKPINRRTNYFGEDVAGTHTVFTTAVSRQLPQTPKELDTKFERILATDGLAQISGPPSSFVGQTMHKFIDEDGMTLSYAFMKEVEKRKVKVDGKRRMTLKQAVEQLISKNSWQKLYNQPMLERTETGKAYNEGLRELNNLMSKYYDAIELELAKDKRFLRRFVNSDDKNLVETLKYEKDIPNVLKSLNLKFQ